MFKRACSVAVVAFFAACGPDAQTLVDSSDVDSDETATTSESELTSSSKASVWFPLSTGNTWTYESSTSNRTVRLASVANGMAEVQGLLAANTWVGVSDTSANTLMQWDASGKAWRAWLRFGYASTTWTMGTQECTGARLKRSATGSATVTPAGSFSDTRTISIEQIPSRTALCAPPAFTELTFAANVGVVAFRTGTGERFFLKTGTVDGRRVPANGSVTATVTLDKTSYVSKPNTIRCITYPCPTNEETAVAQATFTVTNGSTTSQTWQFRTGCQFEMEVLSASGLVVKRLSDDRACTMALTSVTLAAGQSKTWTSPVKLADRDGLQLDGSFSMRARLIPSSTAVTAPVATKAFSVRLQP